MMRVGSRAVLSRMANLPTIIATTSEGSDMAGGSVRLLAMINFHQSAVVNGFEIGLASADLDQI